MQIPDLSRLIENLIRTGTIAEVDHYNKRCRVQSGQLKTDWLPWIAGRAGTTKTWSPPTIGEQCMIFSPSGEPANGIVLTGLYSDSNAAPSSSPNKELMTLPDGGRIEYDHDTSTLSITGLDALTVQANNTITLDCPHVHITGELTVDQDAKINSINFGGHIHTGDDGGNTGAPRNAT